MKNKSKKQINLELLRILSMLMIITLHFLGHGKVLSSVTSGTSSYYMVWFIEGVCFVAVNCYVLISGYFLVDSKFHFKKLFALLIQVFFYSLLIYIIFCIWGGTSFAPLNFFKAFTPTISKEYWFVTIYVGMYVLSPFINILINNMNQKQHIACIFLMILFFSVFPTILFYNNGLNFGDGMGIVWFIVLYLIAAYLKRYFKPTYCIRKYLIGYIFLTSFVPLSKFLLESCSKTFLANAISQDSISKLVIRAYQYNSFFVLSSSIAIFMLFLNIRNDCLSKKILKISPLCFGVYLIHDNNYIRLFLWDLINPAQHAEKWFLPLFLILVVILIFICCALIEFVRIKMFSYIIVHFEFGTLATNIEIKIKKVFFGIFHIN